MNKTIIAVYGSEGKGKSETIKNVCRLIIETFPIAIASENPVDYKGDILVVIQLGQIKIGLESQGDPNSRMLYANTIQKMADKEMDPILGGCDIIVCATRTEGKTVKKVQEIAEDYDFFIIWKSSNRSETLNHSVLNRMAAEDIINLIKSLISLQL